MSAEARCPLCADIMAEPEVRNSLSRFVDSYICNQCGMAEALLNITQQARRCLYFDEIGGTMIVTEDEPGYHPFAITFPRGPKAISWIETYVKAVNERLGLTEKDAIDIVTSSMFGARQKFIDAHYTPRG
ncbi:hypothetical protein [Mycobacteroides abscessus]|uniref:hypothetical protein n=1 Tax=Mycobacteroides abscessus TaxID=36809 RepID=UPI0005E160A9|nr:hypothetical protein [Mycobacteroides abscessus]CPR78954.1 Uncharacterised protein [Mycobacteroides abscessus]CPR88118.1 Uncharacterised protein [Mycobacteroides abscessus]CPS43112.1 Uncharacterised protein [Mycobacteroides abscessus]CPV02880.1 Uncharacterised protein [Mycobacteroides abscessus]